MRADRLVAILMMMQTRGKVTAAEVAAELEVSERTARRDLDALGMAGIPIYSTQGRNGGWELAGGGRTDLSGLTAGEARALFTLAGPLAATPEVKAALHKLMRALPEPLRDTATSASTAMVVDPSGWDRSAATPLRAPPHLDALQRAVIDAEQVELGYVARDRVATTRTVHPLGIAAKANAWYLVAGTDAGMRTFRVDRVTSVVPTGAGAVRPDGFDLAAEWRRIAGEIDERRAPVRAHALCDPDFVGIVRMLIGTRVGIGPTVAGGRVELELRGHSIESLAGEIAGLAGHLEVLDPPEVREQLAAIGATLVETYR